MLTAKLTLIIKLFIFVEQKNTNSDKLCITEKK